MDLLQRCLPHHVSSCHAPQHLQNALRDSLHNVVIQASMSADQLLQTCLGKSWQHCIEYWLMCMCCGAAFQCPEIY